MHRRILSRIALSLAPLPLAACQAQRLLRVRSEPSQAEVRLDGQLVGTTPLELPFDDYGHRRLTVYLDGYRTYSRVVEIAPPWYGAFPFDIFSEVLIPIGWRDVHEFDVQLESGSSVLLAPDLPVVFERADSLRRAGPEGPRPMPARERAQAP